MEKPISLRREELLTAIVSAINNSGLPAFAVVDLLDGVQRQAAELARRQLENDRAAYEKSLEETE